MKAKWWSRLYPQVMCASLLLLLTGCWDRIEINDLALITGAAIDRTNSNEVDLSLQIYVPRAAGGGGMGMGDKGGSGNSNTFVLTSTGVNIADALSHMQDKLSRKLFWGHAEVIIFGEGAAKLGIRDDVDYLMRAPQPRERAYIYVCRNKAKSVLAFQSTLERDTSEVLRELAKSKSMMSFTLAEVSEMLTEKADAFALPWLRELKPPNSDNIGSARYQNGTAIFKNGHMVGLVDEQTSRGMLWLRNEIDYAIVTVVPKGEDGSISVQMLRSKTELIPHIRDGKWSMTVRIHSENDTLQNATSINLASSEAGVRKVEHALEQDMKKQIGSALRRIQLGMQADVFDFAGEFHRAYPQIWKRTENDWDEQFPKVEVKIEPDAVLLRPGLSNVKAKSSD
ncbi:Ger(x)C family spore germination protein [Paenibacillus sp. CF384]|uniref:Ger(x)C family spore germination protein n=1 Tax=Paenibacillus sp. CF384 TaxID=1884382 RepID=UPI0008948389|nr:Ger(x)C family spore germination protein [Paenibacillus sp. CF384]SDW46391.1 spore germination protein KC [Paenibacillus sp. CF384]